MYVDEDHVRKLPVPETTYQSDCCHLEHLASIFTDDKIVQITLDLWNVVNVDIIWNPIKTSVWILVYILDPIRNGSTEYGFF